jgi:WD40-like Beta Propeller Repeat
MGAQGNDDSGFADASRDGRYVAFGSDASNLVSGDTNGFGDVFVRDRRKHTTTRVSVDSAGGQANNASLLPAISADGRYVAFASGASNLDPRDGDFDLDVFVRDRLRGTTELVSVNGAGQALDGESSGFDMSADGRYVAFASAAANVVPGDTNDQPDVFVRDLRRSTTERVSLGTAGAQGDGPAGQGPKAVAIDASGRFVAFDSYATNLVPGDTNDSGDVFVRDRARGTTERVDTEGAFLGALSADGRHVLFNSFDADHPGVFLHDRWSRQTERVDVNDAGEPAVGLGFGGALSANGRLAAFASDAPNLVADDGNAFTDAFVRDTRARTTVRVSEPAGGGVPDFNSYPNAFTADGRVLFLESGASNLVSGDSNAASDVFATPVRSKRGPSHPARPSPPG